MRIIDFTISHIEQAEQIAKQNYEKEREFVPALPDVDAIPDLAAFAQNGLGVAAFEDDDMLGFLCAVGPFENAFQSTNAVGVFSPMGANGADHENRAEVYARMYQAAGEKWASAGASSHAICLYAHDLETQDQFFRYGFGLRCIDAIREMDEITAFSPEKYSFNRVASENSSMVMHLDNMLDQSYIDSPFFMYRTGHSESEWFEYWEESNPVCFAAYREGKAVAFILAELEGETFIKDTTGYQHITGLYCLPEHRGRGVSQKLLDMLILNLKADGHTHLGVDYESFNPSGSGFWHKYFTAYTHSVVRRIDEHVLSKR